MSVFQVKKIRSHLSVEEITDLQAAELDSRFLPRSVTPLTSSRLTARPTVPATPHRSHSARVPNQGGQTAHVPGMSASAAPGRMVSARVPEATPLHSARAPNPSSQSTHAPRPVAPSRMLSARVPEATPLHSARVPNQPSQSTHALSPPAPPRMLSARVPESTPLHSARVPRRGDHQSTHALSTVQSPRGGSQMQNGHAAPTELPVTRLSVNSLKIHNGHASGEPNKLVCLPSPSSPRSTHSRAQTSPAEVRIRNSPRDMSSNSDLAVQDIQITPIKEEAKVQSTRAPSTIRFAQSARVLGSTRDTDTRNAVMTPKASPNSPNMSASRKMNNAAQDNSPKYPHPKPNASASAPKLMNSTNHQPNLSNGLHNSADSDFSAAKDPNPSSASGILVNPLLGRPKTAPGLSGFCYSSHEVATRRPLTHNAPTANGQTTVTPGCIRPVLERRGSLASVTSITSELARNKAAERRQDLLEEEHFTQAELESKRQDFLNRITTWMKENPAVTIKPKPIEPEPSTDTKKNQFIYRSRHRVLTAEEIQQQTDKAWRDLAKCRYLRIHESEMDLSGVNTLVRDQLALFRMFKIGNQQQPRTRKQSTAQFPAMPPKEIEAELAVDRGT